MEIERWPASSVRTGGESSQRKGNQLPRGIFVGTTDRSPLVIRSENRSLHEADRETSFRSKYRRLVACRRCYLQENMRVVICCRLALEAGVKDRSPVVASMAGWPAGEQAHRVLSAVTQEDGKRLHMPGVPSSMAGAQAGKVTRPASSLRVTSRRDKGRGFVQVGHGDR